MSKVRNWKTASFQFLLQNTTRTNRLERTRINIISCFHNANRLISIILNFRMWLKYGLRVKSSKSSTP